MHDHSAVLIDLALAEDIGSGDVTTEFFTPVDRRASAFVAARSDGVVSGVELAAKVFVTVDPNLAVEV